jgi:hypothetical protein
MHLKHRRKGVFPSAIDPADAAVREISKSVRYRACPEKRLNDYSADRTKRDLQLEAKV